MGKSKQGVDHIGASRHGQPQDPVPRDLTCLFVPPGGGSCVSSSQPFNHDSIPLTLNTGKSKQGCTEK